jgi:hypothetical protein
MVGIGLHLARCGPSDSFFLVPMSVRFSTNADTREGMKQSQYIQGRQHHTNDRERAKIDLVLPAMASRLPLELHREEKCGANAHTNTFSLSFLRLVLRQLGGLDWEGSAEKANSQCKPASVHFCTPSKKGPQIVPCLVLASREE